MKTLLILILLSLSACTSVNYDYPREESSFIPAVNESELDQLVLRLVEGQPEDVSGIFALDNGLDAIAARLRFAEDAQRTIDVQYYLIKRDQVGQSFLYSLLLAADRGVRIRLLLDDMFNQGFDTDMMALDSHPYIEIRVFNPFNRGVLGRNVGAVFNFSRINRRMHNKSFTVDDRLTVIGGRNIADEYFGAGTKSSFGDLDVIGIGPVVQDVSNMFDIYWEHRTALPLAGFIKPLKDPAAALADCRTRLKQADDSLSLTPYADAVIERAYQGIQDGFDQIRWSTYTLIYDSPDKGIKNKADKSEMIITPLLESLSAADSEAYLISPYFVPRKMLTEGLINASQAGVDISVVTNSLAANNQKTVHGGYAPARKPLLKAGVKLYEVRPDIRIAGSEYVDASALRSTLHTKAYVLDRRQVFIGSFNFDPRSAYINTEMGVLINDAQMGSEFVQRIEAALPKDAWEVSLTDNNKLRWTTLNGDAVTTVKKEPMTSWWQRFKAGFYRILPIRSQL